jgi:serine/threonine-protein kinase
LNQDKLLKARQIFYDALNLDGSQRINFLDEKCADDTELKDEVLSLLKSLENTKDFLEEPLTAVEKSEGLFTDPYLGKQIGNYIIDGEAGVGGMGIVYTGRRNDREFEQKVAIKILKHGVSSEYLLKRFQIERQTLANLQHQNIARLLDGGSTNDGLPYLVMEFIDGIPITEYCNQNNLKITERLKLFCEVCKAVQYAHQNLIIHRDLKPGNILVTKNGIPKLLDFGIAKLIDEDLVDRNDGLTRTGVWHLTPEYASPEQIKGEKITTASDIYSLGVLLYQILTGQQPYKITSSSPVAISKIITEEKILKPSEKLNEAAEITIQAKSKHLQGDLDNIVMKAMHKDPSRRYISAEQFSEDIRRHLVELPVIAQKDTVGYRLSKFIRRHKVGFITSVGFVVFLIASLIVIIWQANIASEERDRARIESQKFERVNKFLQGMLSAVDPNELGRDVRVYDILEKAANDLKTDLKDQPEIEADIRRTLGNTYTNLGQYGEAKPHLYKALELNRQIYGNESPEVATSMHDLGLLYHWIGDYTLADSFYTAALVTDRKVVNEPKQAMADVLNDYALLQSEKGNYDIAEEYFREALDIAANVNGSKNRNVASIMNNLAITLHYKNELEEAEKYYLKAQKLFIKLFGENHPEVATTYNNLAFIYINKDELKKAEEYFNKSYELKVKLKGEDHPDIGLALNNLAAVHLKMKKYNQVESNLKNAVKQLKKTLSNDHVWLGNSYYLFGKLYCETGKLKPAENYLKKSLQIREKHLGTNYLIISQTKSQMGHCLTLQKKYNEAEKLLLETYNLAVEHLEMDNSTTLEILSNIIRLYKAWGKTERAAVFEQKQTKFIQN